MMDDLFEQDLDQMRTAIETSEVISVFFVQIGRSLILDLRADAGDPPGVFIDSMVSSPQQRLFSFRRLRPNMPLPDSITLAPWLNRVQDFNQAGMVWTMMERCRQLGGMELARSVENCYRRLVALELDAQRALIDGTGMETIWKRSDSSRSQSDEEVTR